MKKFSQSIKIHMLFVFAFMQIPINGICESGNGWVKKVFESKGENVKDVAVIISELSDPYKVAVSALAFSPDGKYLATRSAYQLIHIWGWRERRIVHTLERGKGATDGLTSVPLQFSPDGRLLAACHSRAEGNVVV